MLQGSEIALMSAEDDTDINHDEYAVSAGDEDEEEAVGGEDDDMDEEDSGIGFQAEMMKSLDLVKDDASGVHLFENLQRINYEALAQRKRKLDDDQGEGSSKKLRQNETEEATFEEIMESMNGRRKRRRGKLKKKGRRKGGKNRVSQEISGKLGSANMQYAKGCYEEAISILNDVILLAPSLSGPYHTLGRVYTEMGNVNKAMGFYMIAAFSSSKDTPLWKRLVFMSIEQGNIGQAWYCLPKAITADPKDVTLRKLRAFLYLEAKDYKNAAESYNDIVHLCPYDVEALKNAIKFYKESGQSERSVRMLEDYIKDHPPELNPSVVDSVASLCIENNDYEKALAYIGNAKKLPCLQDGFQLSLTIKEGICHAHLRNLDAAEKHPLNVSEKGCIHVDPPNLALSGIHWDCFSHIQAKCTSDQSDLITSVANCLLNLEHYDFALKYYLMLEGNGSDEVFVCLKVAQCYTALKNISSAIQVLYKAVQADEDSIDSRLTLASLLIGQERDADVVLLLSTPPNAGSYIETNGDGRKPWWRDHRIKLKLSCFYRDRGMLEDFVKVVFPLVHESILYVDKKVKHKRLPSSVLSERVKILKDDQATTVFQNFRAPLPRSDMLKASRARRELEKKATLKEERKSAAMTAGLDWESDDSDVEDTQPLKEPPLPALLENEEQFCLIKDLCDALTSLGRFSQACEILGSVLKLSHRILPTQKKEELRSFEARMAFKVNDPYHAFDNVRNIVFHNPLSVVAWNCYYKIALRLENRHWKHEKFLRQMRVEQKDLVPPMIITGNRSTTNSQHQGAAREYLEAYKLMPESPLVNLCAGTSLINLALGLRLENRHQCVAQGLAFLFNNLRLCGEDNQEALYNIARACQHVGLVSFAASYYEKVLAIREKHYPLPEVIEKDQKIVRNRKTVNCDLRREAAFNLHLIYKSSGAVDLARQVLKDYCTF